ncbi:putative ribonuclease H-like domain-containing protein [Tanacetum coccineum]|uniref:Ribonuclease H-like domain-containing protein n=1 Tax=Tanacetum coccineum TaxID=301880 RepID=A0ABQ4X251_9ASTR
MTQPANDEFCQHLSDDLASNHEDASDTSAAPKQQQQVIPQITAISNIKLPILKKEEYHIWAMEMDHYLEYIDNDVWKVIQNGNSKKRISTRKDGVVRILPPVSPAEIHVVEKERNARTILLMAIPKEHLRRFHGMDDAKEIWEAIRTRFSVAAGFADEVIYSLFAKQSEDLDLLHEDLEQIDDVDIEEMDINWQIAMIAIRMKKFYKKTGRRGTNEGKKRDSFYQDQGVGKKEQNQNCLLTMDDGVVNWGEHTVEEVETNHALMAISSNNEVSLCSKTCIDSYNKLKTLCDEQTNQLGEQEAKILAYTLAVKKLEAQVVTFQKQQLSLNEQLTFKANEIYEKDEKLKKYRRIGMKAVKEREQLQKTVDSWKDSSKNLWKLVDSGMTSNSKVGLGYEIQSNNEVLSYEEEMNRTVFNCTEEDFVNKPLYSRFSKTDNFKGVPHPLTGDYTPKPQEEIDDSLYVYGKKGPQKPEPSISDDKFSENSDTSNEEVMSEPKPKETEPSCVTHVKTPRQPMKNQETPKDCDFYEKEMARETDLKKQRVLNTVQLNAVRPNLNSVRSNVNTGRAKVNSVRQNVSSVTSNVNTGSFNVNTVRSKQPVSTNNSNSFSPVRSQDHPLKNMEDRGIFDSGCSGHMTGNKDHLDDLEEYKGGSVTFGELGHFNIFSISQICDKQHKVFFTETKCLVMSPDFKMPDKNQILLKVPRQHNMYSFDMKTPSPAKVFACLIAKATSDESKLWHRRLRHINFKNLNKLVKGNLVRGLPSNVFRHDHTCVACQKGKQHRASCKAKLERIVTEPLHILHMDLFGPTSDETSGILQTFIRQIENQLNHKVKIIRLDNGTEFKNRDILEFCGNKGIKQEYSNARTPQQNGVAERMNRTLIEAARTMLADSLLPTTF